MTYATTPTLKDTRSLRRQSERPLSHLERGCKRFLFPPVRMVGCERLDAIDREEASKIVRLLTPERAVVVKRRNSFGCRDEIR